MKVLVTGSKGFIGLNLCLRLRENAKYRVLEFHRGNSENLKSLIADADVIVHLAGINRPQNPEEFKTGNTDLTAQIVQYVKEAGTNKRIILASSTQAELNNPYGISKLQAEEILLKSGLDAVILRLPNVFGKWCKPFYNSAVATFCHKLARDEEIVINDANHEMTLLYVDDLVTHITSLLDKKLDTSHFNVSPTYKIKLGELANLLKEISHLKDINNPLGQTGQGLYRALYATYVSYLPPEKFSYPVKGYSDQRGTFVEMLRTKDSGQISFFTAKPGITRGGHYHHTKTEKFLVVKGTANFKFRHMITNEKFELQTSDNNPMIVESIPGWSHNITNIGDNEMIVMLWANELFDRQNPDTITAEV